MIFNKSPFFSCNLKKAQQICLDFPQKHLLMDWAKSEIWHNCCNRFYFPYIFHKNKLIGASPGRDYVLTSGMIHQKGGGRSAGYGKRGVCY
jgi:hypothetical protein